VISGLELGIGRTKLLAIIANTRGAEEAVCYDEISYLGFPFSISPTFQLRNTNSTQEESLQRIDEIQELCIKNNKQLVVYLSMGFGNPYGDIYNQEILLKWADEMVNRNIEIISLADTVGLGTPEQISFALKTLIPQYSNTSFGVHLHSTKFNWKEKLQAAVDAGCKRFDGALKGIGGCPMAQDDLVGNMDSEKMIAYFEEHNLFNNYNKTALAQSLLMADSIFI
jgi:hydroxymethylglutaryl-CoA lyase